ncbi:MAG: hypothetical protein KGD68_13160 [Candidatus Lokiarchaeota archaeon]|nr:hypothetical protein [Candidatus Lokiarchaeota archaeon]
MAKLNIDFLIKTPIKNILEKINYFFHELLQEIESYLQIEVIYTKINIILKNEASISGVVDNIFSVGVDRSYNNDVLTIKIFSDFYQYIQYIMLREAYKCFIPNFVNQMKIIDIFINQKILIDLNKLKSSNEWNLLIRNKLVNYEFISGEFDRLENFLKRESTEKIDSPFIFFFKYIRKNIQIIGDSEQNFYETFFKEFYLISSKSLFNDEIIETIRVLNKIFNQVKYYSALLDYQDYFSLFKENGVIETKLSLNKFTENMQWIKNFSSLSPSYKINWPSLNILSINCCFKFNPIIKRSEIAKFINELPFFVLLKDSRNSFGFEIEGYFVIPKIYFNDLKIYLKKFRDYEYTLQIRLSVLESVGNFVNLNYFREYHNRKTILNRNHKFYDIKYELGSPIAYAKEVVMPNLSLLDWLIIDRIRYFSQTGFNFERRAGTLKLLKTDLINETISQRKFITDLKTNLLVIHLSLKLKNSFLEFLKINESFGFFYIKNMLNDYIVTFKVIKEILTKNPSINSIFKFHEHFNRQGVSNSIENNITFKNSTIRKAIFNHFLPIYFKSKENFEEEINKYTSFFKVIRSCNDLKIFSMQSIRMIVKNRSLIDTIYKSKEEKLMSSYESYELSDLTYQLIEEKLDCYLNSKPPVIKPNLTDNILVSMVQVFIVLLKNNEETLDNLKKISFISKRLGIASGEILNIALLIPYLSNSEKGTFISLLINLFKENLISVKRYLWSNFQQAFSRKVFYDLEQKKFFYTKDLFKQFFLNVRNIIGDVQKPLPEIQNMQQKRFWSDEKDVSYLIKEVEDRVRNETIDLSSEILRILFEFHTLLGKNILNIDEFKESQDNFFFKNCINSIDIIPSFQNFGISQYFLYFYPTDIEKINFKLLLNNAFQSISYPAQIDNSNSFLIQYIYPYRNPGIVSYLNWLTKSKKIIREYCLFFIKKFYQILHFDYNLSSEGWDLDPNRFKIYFQNVLFNPDYKVQIPDLKEFNIGDLNSSNYHGPNSSEFKALSQIYNWKSLDIKSFLTRRYFKINTNIIELLKKGLIQPSISLKNLDLVEEITIILPDVKKENNESILKIFSFFNIGFIFEMEGEYYIHGFENIMKFENGIMIKLYFPDCQIDEFEKLFDLLFEYMEIDHFLILNDLVDGENLIKSTFNGLKFLETYNPLTNLIWNAKDKKWRNHKLFNENFEPVYPDLFFGKNNYDLDS